MRIWPTVLILEKQRLKLLQQGHERRTSSANITIQPHPRNISLGLNDSTTRHATSIIASFLFDTPPLLPLCHAPLAIILATPPPVCGDHALRMLVCRLHTAKPPVPITGQRLHHTGAALTEQPGLSRQYRQPRSKPERRAAKKLQRQASRFLPRERRRRAQRQLQEFPGTRATKVLPE